MSAGGSTIGNKHVGKPLCIQVTPGHVSPAEPKKKKQTELTDIIFYKNGTSACQWLHLDAANNLTYPYGSNYIAGIKTCMLLQQQT